MTSPLGVPTARNTATLGRLSTESPRGEVRYLGPMMKRLAPPAEAYIELAPGATERRVLDLTKGYGVTEAGTYRVRFERPLLDVVHRHGTVPSRQADHRRVTLGSVEATVVVAH